MGLIPLIMRIYAKDRCHEAVSYGCQVPRVMMELHLESNFRFVPIGMGPKIDHQGFKGSIREQNWLRSMESLNFTTKAQMKQSYFRSARYACGQLFVSSVITSLAVNQVFQPSLGTLIKNFSDNLALMDIPEDLIGEKYNKLMKHMYDEGYLCVGLWRKCRSMAKTLGAMTSLGMIDHFYPLIAPPIYGTELEAGDMVYVLTHGFTYSLDATK